MCSPAGALGMSVASNPAPRWLFNSGPPLLATNPQRLRAALVPGWTKPAPRIDLSLPRTGQALPDSSGAGSSLPASFFSALARCPRTRSVPGSPPRLSGLLGGEDLHREPVVRFSLASSHRSRNIRSPLGLAPLRLVARWSVLDRKACRGGTSARPSLPGNGAPEGSAHSRLDVPDSLRSARLTGP